MPIVYQEWITRQNLQDNPDKLYVFGDNMRRYGLGGQAREMRGERNAIGIPTKREPTMRPGAFFSDNDFDQWLEVAEPAFDYLKMALIDGRTVVFPKNGLGTGLAQLPERAPRINQKINEFIEEIETLKEGYLE